MLGKRFIDVLLSIIAIVVFSPIMLGIGLVVYFDTGLPISFKQLRLGKNGRLFKIIKFRTMIVAAPDIRNPDGSTYSAPDDPRLTKVGRFLRSTSLDELPQLFNVLKGEMSLVGPRPDQVDQYQYYAEAELVKLHVKPGITGLAQISGRNAIPWETRKALDVYYVNNFSLKLDLEILFKTIPYVLLKRDVYTLPQSLSAEMSDENIVSG